MIEIKVPASSANIGTGIDCMGIALNLYLTAQFSKSDHLSVTLGGSDIRSLALEENHVYMGAKRIFDLADTPFPSMNIHIETNIPISRGLGSSASSVVAGMWGANLLLGEPFDFDTLLHEATLFEGHPDNVVPCVVGGFTISMQTDKKIYYHKVDMSKKLSVIAAIPDFELPTSIARKILPTKVDLHDVLQQIQRACFLSMAMANENYADLALATDDKIFTPARHTLIPGFDAVIRAAMDAGALCAMISGAGPSIIAFASNDCQDIANAMTEAFKTACITARSYILLPDNEGVKSIIRK